MSKETHNDILSANERAKTAAYRDAEVYARLEGIIQRHINNALSECDAIVRKEIQRADPAKVMASLNEYLAWDRVGDLYSDAVFDFREALCDDGIDFYTAYNKEPLRMTRAFVGPVKVSS